MRGRLYSEILRGGMIAWAGLMLLATQPAEAGENITLYSAHSTLVNLSKRPGTVVVGDPSIADVTLDGERLFLHGRGFGNTNVTILDESGHTIADYEVYVTLQEANAASVFKGGARQSFSCVSDCQPTLTVGDLYTPHFKNLVSAITAKTAISRNQKGGDEAITPVVTPAPLTQ